MAVQARLKALLDAEGYDVQRELGQGQFGKVVLAKARTSGSLVAVKVVAESFSSANERSMIGRPTHPNVLQIFKSIHDAATDVNVCFLEFCNGGDMEAMLSSENRALNNRQLLVFTTQVASGLQFLHSQNIAHRDIKPSNILLNIEDGWTTYKLGDFGTARDKTMMETLAGTPYYMAPEVEAGSYGKEIDLWSLGCTIFYCCTLRQLFEANNRVELRDMVSRTLTPEVVRTRLASAAHCQLSEEERERLAFALSALVQIRPAERMSVAELLQQFQPQARIIDVRTSDEHTVAISIAHRPTVRSLATQVADVFARSAENLYLHDHQGELTDARLQELLWGRALIELRLTDIEAYLSASVPSPDDTEYEAVELQESPDASHALACLPALAHSNELKLRSRLPEHEAVASLRDSVTRELSAATAKIEHVRFVKELLAGIEGVPEDDTMLSALADIEKHVGLADSVVKDATVFFCSIDSPLATLVRVLSTLQLPSSVSMADLPQLLHKHLATQATRTEALYASQRALLRELLHKHSVLSELFAPHGAVTRATQALGRLRTHMHGLVERTARTHAQQATSASVDSTVAALRAQHAAELAQLGRAQAGLLAKAQADHQAAVAQLGSERTAETNNMVRQHVEAMARAADQHAATLNQMRAEHAVALERMRQECTSAGGAATVMIEAELRKVRDALSKACAALEAREDEVDLKPSDAPFAERLKAVLERFYERSHAQALAQSRSELLSLQHVHEMVTREKEQLAMRVQSVTTDLKAALAEAQKSTADSQVQLQAAMVHSQQVESEAMAMRQSIAALKSSVESSHARVNELEASNAQLATEMADRERTNTALRERIGVHERQQAELQARIDSLERSTRLAKDELLTKTEMLAHSEGLNAALTAEQTALKQRLANEADKSRAAAQRIAQLENGMRDTAATVLQLQTTLHARDTELKALRSDMARSVAPAAASSPSGRPVVPLYTPPPMTQPTQPPMPFFGERSQPLVPAVPRAQMPAGSPQSELARLRAENANLQATVTKLTEELDATRPATLRIKELELERERLRDLARSEGTEVIWQLRRENDDLTRILRQLQDQIAAERAARSTLEDQHESLEGEARRLQEHVRRLAQENERLQTCYVHGELAETVIHTTRFLFPLANAHEVHECCAQLRRMIGRGDSLTLLALADVQFGDRVYVTADKRILQRPGQPPLQLANPDLVEAESVCSVILIEDGGVHVTA